MKHTVVIFLFLNVVICPVSAQDTVRVYAGWNNIGSLSSGAIPDVLATEPPGIITTAMWKYNPGAGYESSDTLEMGRGYWVKVSADGLIIFGSPGSADTCDVQTVDYDGYTYHTVKIGSQCWLKENLDVGVMIQGTDTSKDNATIEKYCYNNDTGNCGIYGGLYRWNEAMQYSNLPGVQGICPPGWHIPAEAEFQTLSSTVGADGNALKAIGQGTGGGAGTNTSGFSALLAGWKDHAGAFFNLGANAGLQSSTDSPPYARVLDINGSSSYFSLANSIKSFGFSVRCLED